MTSAVTEIRASRMFDGVADTLVADPVVAIEGGTIAHIGTGPMVRNGRRGIAGVIDLPGATLIPGLIDTHVHLAFDASSDPVGALATRSDLQVIESMRRSALAALAGGVTTLRDLGDSHYLSLGLRGQVGLPTILGSGPPITTRAGHCHFLGGAVDPTSEAVRRAVRERRDRGADIVKIMASGGNLTPGSRQELCQFPAEVLAAAVREAHRCGLPITAHAHAVPAVADAIAARVDGIEHATFWTADGVDARADLIAAIVAGGIIVGMTAGVCPVAGVGPPPEVARRLRAITSTMAALHRAGAVMVAGTDAGIGPVKPPDVVRYAPPALIQIGMTPARALRTVTSTAAAAIGLGHIKGRLRPGYDADILAVDGNPLSDPGALHSIRAVICRGSLVRRDL